MSLLPRPLPTETITNLAPPMPGFPYFAHADRFSFESEAATYSPINAWWLADASFSVYGDSSFVQQVFDHSPLPAQGFQFDWLGTREENRGMILQNQESLIIVFRGTRVTSLTLMDAAELVLIHRDDLWIDSQFLPTVFRTGGRVHDGFRDAFLEVRDMLAAVLQAKQPRQKLWLAGHSLGGALATLAASFADSVPVQGLYTYGAPRVGDQAFVRTLPHHSHYRFVHRGDWIPTVPPELLGYVHGGIQRDLAGAGPRGIWNDLARGTDMLVEAVKSMASESRIDIGKLPFKVSGLADHAPIYYATLLWNELLTDSATA